MHLSATLACSHAHRVPGCERDCPRLPDWAPVPELRHLPCHDCALRPQFGNGRLCYALFFGCRQRCSPTAVLCSRRLSTALQRSRRRCGASEPIPRHPTRLSLAPPLSTAQFDSVAYSFGGSIIYFLQGYLERIKPGSYFDALNRYMTKHAYGNAEVCAAWLPSFERALHTASPSPRAANGLVGRLCGRQWDRQPDHLHGGVHIPGAWAAALQGGCVGPPCAPRPPPPPRAQVGYPMVTLSWTDPSGAATGVGSLQVSQSRHIYSNYSIDLTPQVRGGTRGVARSSRRGCYSCCLCA